MQQSTPLRYTVYAWLNQLAAIQLAVRLCLNMAKRRKSERAPLARQKHIKKPCLVLSMI